MWKKIVIGVLVIVFGVFQVRTMSKPSKEVIPEQDFMNVENPPAEIQSLLKSACTDCHSNETNYRWYNYVGFVGNWIDGHIEHGSNNLNFSEWGTYDRERKQHKIKEIVDEIKANEMPLRSYTWTHSDAKLDESQKQALIDYFNQLAP